MNDFISTNNGKVININQIAFLTSRTNPKSLRQDSSKKIYRVKGEVPVQLVVAFSAAAESQAGMIPLSLVLEGDEANDLLDQMAARGVTVDAIRKRISEPPSEQDVEV